MDQSWRMRHGPRDQGRARRAALRAVVSRRPLVVMDVGDTIRTGKTASGGETVTVAPAGGNPPANGATYNIYAANDPNAIIAALQHRQAVERAMA